MIRMAANPKSIMKKLFLLIPLVTVALVASASDYDKQIDAAIESIAGGVVDIDKHQFAVQSPKIEDKDKKKRGHTLLGEISLIASKDAKPQTIAYRVQREKGIKSIELQTNDGMWLPVSEAVMKALGGYVTGGPMTEEAQQEVARALAKLLDGSPRRAAEVLIARITIRHC
jgi:hypothetical protein